MSQSISESIGTLLLRAISAGSIRGSLQAFFQSTEALWIDPWIDPKPPRSIGNIRIDRDPTVGVDKGRRRTIPSASLHRITPDLSPTPPQRSQRSDRQFLKDLGSFPSQEADQRQEEKLGLGFSVLIVSFALVFCFPFLSSCTESLVGLLRPR